MVDQEIVFDTIKKMKESGLEDDIIISTLQDIGLDEPQARELIRKVASGESPAVAPAAAPIVVPPVQQVAPAPIAEPQPAAQPATVVQPSPVQPPVPVSPFGIPQKPQSQAEQVIEDLDDNTAAAIEEVFEGAIQSEQSSFAPQTAQAVPGSNQGTLRTVQQLKTIPMPQPRTTQPQPAPLAPVFPGEEIALKTADKVRDHLAVRSEEEAMRHAATQSQLSDQTRQLTEMQSKINKIVKAKPIQMPPGTPPEIKALAREIGQLKEDVSDTKALGLATKSLMEKILEANRKILSRLP